MIIYTAFDSSTANAPAGFFNAVNAAVEYWERAIVDPISVTIEFGWGSVAGHTLDAGALGESSASGVTLNYAQVRQALVSHATSANQITAANSLPVGDPTGGGAFFVADAEAMVLGLATDGASVQGAVGMASNTSFTFDPFNRAVPGDYDAIGVMEHEITEVLGRLADSGIVSNGVHNYDPLDLFRYTGPGQMALTPEAASFSINGGQTLLLPFNTPTFSDAGDWAPSVVGDAFGEGMFGHAQTVSPTDLELMNVLGFTLAADPTARNDFNADGKSSFLIQNTSGAVVVGEDVNGSAHFTTVSGLGPEWKFVLDGDFLGSGSDQFLIENNTGAVFDGQAMNGSETYTQVAALGSEWKFVGAGDFLALADGDQFLMENTAGSVVVGNVISLKPVYTQVASLGPEWKFVGAGDFFGTGPSEFIIENNHGAVDLGQVVNGAAVFTQVASLGSEWTFVGAGDFLADGKDQFLIENSSGAVVAGEVRNGSAVYTQLASLGPEWHFVGAGDYTGEGHDSFLIENAAGAVVIGDYSGGQIHYAQVAGLGSEWLFH